MPLLYALWTLLFRERGYEFDDPFSLSTNITKFCNPTTSNMTAAIQPLPVTHSCKLFLMRSMVWKQVGHATGWKPNMQTEKANTSVTCLSVNLSVVTFLSTFLSAAQIFLSLIHWLLIELGLKVFKHTQLYLDVSCIMQHLLRAMSTHLLKGRYIIVWLNYITLHTKSLYLTKYQGYKVPHCGPVTSNK